MNPSYPVNGSPYQQQQPYNPNNRPQQHVGPGMAGAPQQYTYALHPHPQTSYPPPHPGYAPYPQYSQHVMMYAPPRTSQPPDSAPAPTPTPPTTKRKRKSSSGDSAKKTVEDDEGGSDSEGGGARAQAAAALEMKKRTKTQRACDSCRSRKIRCDILSTAESPVCQHCKQYGFECTFFLPITETRFKKKRLEEEALAAAERDKTVEADGASPRTGSPPKGEVKVFGPTSAQHLLHSTATVSPRIYESYDTRYHHSWEVGQTGDGLIQVFEPHADADTQLTIPKPVDLRIERDVIEKLVNSYFSDLAPLLPVVTQPEFLSSPSPPPILLYSICLVAAAQRSVPQSVFESLRATVGSIVRSEEVLSTASIVNVQALLVLGMCGDCHSQFVPNALSALWVRMGAAIRMAQDLGLHRAEAVKQNIEMRRRLWGACVIADRWTSVTYGHPYMINVEDCDARLPSTGNPHDLYMGELVRLSIILGRVMKTIYTPSGLTLTTDEMLYALLADIEAWKERLPDSLKYKGPQTHRNAGLLHLLYACVCMIFWRVFMRISYSCPAHLKFALTVERWTELVHLTGEAIEWLDAHEQVFDVWLPVSYAATSCALVQYHTWVRRREDETVTRLRKLRDCVKRWDQSLPAEHMSTRRKTAEICALLYEATQGEPLPTEKPALNPTGGVTGRVPDALRGLTYKKDATRPGGGVFVAHGAARGGDFTNIPEGVVIMKEPATDDENGEDDDQLSEGETPAIIEVSPVSTPNDKSVLSSSSAAAAPPPSSIRHLDKIPVVVPARHRAARNGGGTISAPAVAAVGQTQQHQQLHQQQQQQQQQHHVSAANNVPAHVHGSTDMTTPSTMVHFTPLGSNFPNLNPALNEPVDGAPNHVQVMNVLDAPGSGSGTLEQFAIADLGLLNGIPDTFFDWNQWDSFFSRVAPPTTGFTIQDNSMQQLQQQHQQQHHHHSPQSPHNNSHHQHHPS